jgi:hypothetical protein
MQSKSYRQMPGIAPALACLVCCLAGGCIAKHPPPPRFQADFNVAPASGGRYIVWWLRMSGPEFTAMVHRSAREPQLGSVDDLVHRQVDTMVVAGLTLHGLVPCDPNRRTIAIMKDGTVQFTGYCPIPSAVPTSGRLQPGT